jgi:agmatinase
MTSSFLSLPNDRCNPLTARYRIIPVPYEKTVCFLGGTAKGPEAIMSVSDQMEPFDEELLCDWTRQGIATFPPIPSADTPEKMFDQIYQTVKQEAYFQPDKFPIFLGGEHSITPPIIRAASETYGTISVLQFDAHADLRDTYTGGKFSHASAMRRVLEITPHLVGVGIRSFSEEEYTEVGLKFPSRIRPARQRRPVAGSQAFERGRSLPPDPARVCPKQIATLITPRMFMQEREHCIMTILERLTEYVYITVDIDVFDPAFAPGTGTPEPCGLDWFQVTEVLRRVCAAKKVVGADVVEVAPLGGNHVVTEFLAARLVAKIIAYSSRA